MKGKIAYIQGLRALCCIAIALVHFFGIFYHNGNYFLISPMGRFLLSPLRGSTGVVLFSMLGGYFALSYVKKHSNNIGEYLVLRYTKMWVSVLTIGILWFFLSKLFIGFNIYEPRIIVEKYTYLYQYIINSFFINDRILGVFWPLLSIFLGTVIVALSNKYVETTSQKIFILIAFSFGTFLLGNKVIDIVCLGGILGLLEDTKILNNIRNSKWKYICFIFGWLLMSYDDKSTRIGFLILALGAFALLIAVPSIRLIKNILSSNLLTKIGNYSFEIYCIHFIIVSVLLFLLDLSGFQYSENVSKKWLILLLLSYFVLTSIFSVLLNIFTNYIYKKINGYAIKMFDYAVNTYNRIRNTINKNDIWFFVCMGVFLILLCSYVSNSSMSTENYLGHYSMDYTIHNQKADTIFDGLHNETNKFMKVVYTYPLYHTTAKAISIVTGLPIHFTSGLTISIYILLTVLIVRHYLLQNSNLKSINKINALSFSSIILINLYIPSIGSTLFYPQGAPNLWHNPTYLVARPFALLTAYTFLKFFQKDVVTKKGILQMAFSSFLCSFAKPSYAIVFYPIAGLMVFIKFCIKPKKNYKYLISWILSILPSIILNVIQYAYMALSERGSGIIFEFKWPLEQGIGYFFIMVLFPVFVFLAHGYKYYKSPINIFMWGTVILGWIEYFVTPIADYIWGYEMSVFMIMVYSAKLLFLDSTNKKIQIIGAAIWIAQTIFGLAYFITGLFGSSLIY